MAVRPRGGDAAVAWPSRSITDETLEPFDLDSVQPGDVVGIGHSHRQRASRLRDRHARDGPEVRPSCSAVSTRRSTRRRRRVSAARTPSSRRRRRGLAPGPRGRGAGHVAAESRGRTCRCRSVRARRDGSCCRRGGTCGARSRRCAAARNIARSARSGAPMARNRDSAASMPSSARSSSSVAGGFGSSRWPTTTSIR